MLNQKRSLFRKESLERLSSPERLDQLMQIVSPKSWLALVALGSLVGVGIIWSIYGRIPITVDGRGVMIYPRKVVPLQSLSSGQLLVLNTKVGDIVKKGQVLATVDQVDLRKQLQLAGAKLFQLEGQDSNASLLQGQRQQIDTKAIQEQRLTLQQRLKIIQDLTPVLKEKGLLSIERDRLNLKRRLQILQGLLPTHKKRLDNRQRLLREGAIPDDVVLEAQQQYDNARASIDEAESQLKQLDLKEADAQQQYLSNLNEIKNIQAQLQEQNSKVASLAQESLQTTTTRKNEIQELKREIAKLEQQLATNSQIISQHNGRILEITVTPGQVVNAGTRLGSIDEDNPSSKMVSITYFAIAEGKKIQPGMSIQITPQTVKRERFGGIVGTITSVSAFPITKEGATNVVGNPEIVEGLMSGKQEGVMQVFADLEPDSSSFSGYKWASSTGPQLKISSGTTTVVRVKVEERAPITYVLPILRSVSGIN
ncbi:NHLP bacteriocin system secretion protein [Nostoc sphaeroides CHAB 2801]|uniref:NHLP bacteriocin system secretion protein n=1 Tax=Nostoc sphaeroides TaxID=446679 RepID=UPI001E5F176C|nr:NHLP bacteriocin system secretion protein [Nostoc sphaeroides]MCC5632945.1 NHLP bacteriocin system secretion protein [Nostoc sphaeroides CHAB 2801]